MPRLPRQIRPGRVYHLISRFVDRDWYITSESERACYLRLLGHALDESDWRCLAYVVMSNHVHLATIAGEQPLHAWVRRVHSPFADWMNRMHDRIGPMFVRGPKDHEVRRDQVGALIAYIHNNPVRAAVVHAPRESTWTSHRAYLGLEPPPHWLHVGDALERAGFADATSFDHWVTSDPDEREAEAMQIDRRIETPSNCRSRARAPRPAAIEIVRITAAALEIPISRICSSRRGAHEVLARHVAVHCASTFGLAGAEIATALGISQQRVSVIHRRAVPRDVLELSARVAVRLSSTSCD